MLMSRDRKKRGQVGIVTTKIAIKIIAPKLQF